MRVGHIAICQDPHNAYGVSDHQIKDLKNDGHDPQHGSTYDKHHAVGLALGMQIYGTPRQRYPEVEALHEGFYGRGMLSTFKFPGMPNADTGVRGDASRSGAADDAVISRTCNFCAENTHEYQ